MIYKIEVSEKKIYSRKTASLHKALSYIDRLFIFIKCGWMLHKTVFNMPNIQSLMFYNARSLLFDCMFFSLLKDLHVSCINLLVL